MNTTSNTSTTPSGAASTQVSGVTSFVYTFNNFDLSYDTTQYPVAGAFDAITSPWFENFATIPTNWQPDATDQANLKNRLYSAFYPFPTPGTVPTYIQTNVPGQTYSGTAIEQIQQRYTKGFWDPSIFNQSLIDTLTQNWINDDAEFARQRLGGPNPNVLTKYTGTNSQLDAWVTGSAGANNKTTLTQALQSANTANTLFVCDYTSVFGNIITNKFVQNGQYFCTPIAYFTVVNNALMPLAIQLQPGNGYIFTPQDDANSWLLAKLWVGSADILMWFAGTHFFYAHSMVMIFSIAALNQIQSGSMTEDHPIMTLVYPHLQSVFNINNAIYSVTGPAQPTSSPPANLPANSGYGGLYQVGNFCDTSLPVGRIGVYQIINNLYKNYNFDEMAFDKILASRKVDADNLKVSFPYRDDGQIWWQAIQDFVGHVVDATYANDAAVAADAQLNAWLNTAQSAFNQDSVKRFTWTATASYLKECLTNLIFTASAQHAAVNNSQVNSWSFVPNGAYAMISAPPTGAGVTDAELLASLPDPQNVAARGVIQGQISASMAGTPIVSDVAAGDGTANSLYTMYAYSQTTQPNQYNAVTGFYNALWTGDNSVKDQITNNQNTRITSFKTNNASATTVPNSVSYYYLSVKSQVDMNICAPVTTCIQV